MATSTTSAFSSCASPPLAGSSVRVTPSLHLCGAAVTLVDSRNLMPCLPSTRSNALPTSPSMPGTSAVEEFDDGDLGAETVPDAAEFKADIAAADDDEVAGHVIEFEPAGRGDDLLLVDLDARQRNALAAGGDDDVLGLVFGAVDG